MARQIALLPQEVVDRIAAGEVVQRPVSVVKELLENALDAGATKVVITFMPSPSSNHGGCGKIVVSDNGRGMSPDDLPLAARRHATSKLRSVDDFDDLQSFGFRGEALASVSMVSRLTIVSRTKATPSGYSMSYTDGKPTASEPTPRARPMGTTINVQDLFFNLKQRRPSREDYKQILEVLQKYAIACASRGVGLSCEKVAGKQSSTDLNTAMGLIPTLQKALASESGQDSEDVADLRKRATKQVITAMYGAALEGHLKEFDIQSSSDEADDKELMYSCTGWIALPSYALAATKKERPQFIIFINDRLVDCRPMQRALDEVYVEFAAAKTPFAFLSVQVSPTTVDVNIHPNKRECALLNQDAIIKSLAEHFREVLQKAGKSFSVASIEKPTIANPYKRRKSDPNENEPSLSQTSQKSVAPSKKIRTSRATQSGALEPFLVRKEPLSQASDATNASSQLSPTQLTQESAGSPSQRSPMVHMRGCPLAEPANVDLTQPGAFASVSSQCTCNLPDTSGAAAAIRLPRQALSRPKRLPPKECHYESILSLRKTSLVQVDKDAENKLRRAYFVGVVSPHRSLVQVEEELIILNHGNAAEELFYQLALNHFPGGAAVAKVGESGVDIHSIVAEFVQTEETLQSSSPLPAKVAISETNQVLAEQATACLFQHAEMLRDYFSVIIQKNPENDRVMLTGLPILLEGYAPSPHALPLFLLRLATEVNWTEEKPCFRGICQELGRFNASIPTDDHLASHVQHALFPALSSLLLPSKPFVTQKGFYGVTKLSKLYRVFERC